jgi:hypothetical protein
MVPDGELFRRSDQIKRLVFSVDEGEGVGGDGAESVREADGPSGHLAIPKLAVREVH